MINYRFALWWHAQNICKFCLAHIRDLKHLRGYLTRHAARMATNALVGSRLDYCNSLFRSLLDLDLHKLQCLQNTSLLLGRLSIGCLLTIPYLRLPYWCTNSYLMVIQNILYLSLNLDIVFITHVEAKLMGVSLEVPHFATSIYKSSKHFGLSFAYA